MGRRLGAMGTGLLLALLLLWAPSTASAAETCEGADTPVSSASVAAAERTMLCLVNLHREANGLAPLAMEPSLRNAARGHSEDMVARNYFCHEYGPGCDGYKPGDPQSTPSSRAAAAGYSGGVGENIAADSRSSTSPQTMFTQWRNSSGHNANMLGKDYRVFGMGFALGYPDARYSGGATGTQMFGSRDTGATDTADDLVVEEGGAEPPPDDPPADDPPSGDDPPADDPGAGDCAAARDEKASAAKQHRKARAKVKRLRGKVERKSGKAKRKAKRRLRRAKQARRDAAAELSAAKAAVKASCRAAG